MSAGEMALALAHRIQDDWLNDQRGTHADLRDATVAAVEPLVAALERATEWVRESDDYAERWTCGKPSAPTCVHPAPDGRDCWFHRRDAILRDPALSALREGK